MAVNQGLLLTFSRTHVHGINFLFHCNNRCCQVVLIGNNYSMNKLLLISILLVFASSCGKRSSTMELIRNDASGNMEIISVLKKDTSVREGMSALLSPEGDTIEKTFYKSGSIDGTRTLYHSNGGISVIEHYAANTYQGPFESYFPDGAPKVKGQYLNGQMDGVWTYYYAEPGGQVKELVTFKGNAENGPFTEFFPNGQKAAEGNLQR
jgi:antitoxin component YwqK of YwqJK toxin-antitoxin module